MLQQVHVNCGSHNQDSSLLCLALFSSGEYSIDKGKYKTVITNLVFIITFTPVKLEFTVILNYSLYNCNNKRAENVIRSR